MSTEGSCYISRKATETPHSKIKAFLDIQRNSGGNSKELPWTIFPKKVHIKQTQGNLLIANRRSTHVEGNTQQWFRGKWARISADLSQVSRREKLRSKLHLHALRRRESPFPAFWWCVLKIGSLSPWKPWRCVEKFTSFVCISTDFFRVYESWHIKHTK